MQNSPDVFLPVAQEIALDRPKNNRSPSCLLQEDQYEYQILFHMREADTFDLKLFLSRDQKRLHVLAQGKNLRAEDQYLWSFRLPRMADRHQIEIEQRGALSLVHIPKRRLLKNLEALIPQTVTSRPAYAS